MNEQLFLRYHLDNLIREKYCLDGKMYNFDDYDIDDFEFKNLDFYYLDGRQCKIKDYEWSQDGKWSNIKNITVVFEDGEQIENLGAYCLYLTEESLEKCSWYFIDSEYY